MLNNTNCIFWQLYIIARPRFLQRLGAKGPSDFICPSSGPLLRRTPLKLIRKQRKTFEGNYFIINKVPNRPNPKYSKFKYFSFSTKLQVFQLFSHSKSKKFQRSQTKSFNLFWQLYSYVHNWSRIKYYKYITDSFIFGIEG